MENEILDMIKSKKTCKDCGWAIHYPSIGTVVCGVHHTSFSDKSLCDDFLTPEQRDAVNKERHQLVRNKMAGE